MSARWSPSPGKSGFHTEVYHWGHVQCWMCLVICFFVSNLACLGRVRCSSSLRRPCGSIDFELLQISISHNLKSYMRFLLAHSPQSLDPWLEHTPILPSWWIWGLSFRNQCIQCSFQAMSSYSTQVHWKQKHVDYLPHTVKSKPLAYPTNEQSSRCSSTNQALRKH